MGICAVFYSMGGKYLEQALHVLCFPTFGMGAVREAHNWDYPSPRNQWSLGDSAVFRVLE